MPVPAGYALDKPVKLPPGYTLDPAPTSTTPAAPPAPDFTTNSIDPATGTGYGLYRMGSYDFNEGQVSQPEIQVPFNRVQDALAAGLKLHPDEAPRYQNDLAHNSPWSRGAGQVKSLLSRMTEPMADTPLVGSPWQQANAAAANVEKLPFNLVNRTVRGVVGLPQGVTQAAVDFTQGRPEGVDPAAMLENSYKGMQQDASTLGPVAALGNLGGDAATMAIAGKVIPKVAETATEPMLEVVRGVSKIPENIKRAITDTGSGPVKELVKKAQAANENIDADNALTVQKHLVDTQDALHETTGRELQHQQALKTAEDEARTATADARKKYIADRQAIETANQQAEAARRTALAQQAKITPLRARVQAAWRALLGSVETARARSLAIGNAKYSGVNSALSHIESDPEFFPNAVANATESLRGSKSDPTLLRSMETAIKGGNVATYADLQGDYSALGKEISKGSLPGDVFHAYDELHEAIGDEMQRIADSKGQGKALLDARNYWRRMKQTFGQPLTVSDAATKALRTSAPDLAAADEQANRIRLLGSFDPHIPQIANHIQNLQKGIDALPTSESPRQITKKFAEAYKSPTSVPRPGVVEPAPVKPVERVAPPDRPDLKPRTTISSPDIVAARRAAAEARAGKTLTRGTWVATWPVFQAMRALWGGHIPSIPVMALESAGTYATTRAATALMRHPPMIRFLTEARPEDIPLIPPDLRGDLPGLVNLARQQGVKVSPALVAAAAGAAGTAGSQQQPQSQPTSPPPLPQFTPAQAMQAVSGAAQ